MQHPRWNTREASQPGFGRRAIPRQLVLAAFLGAPALACAKLERAPLEAAPREPAPLEPAGPSAGGASSSADPSGTPVVATDAGPGPVAACAPARASNVLGRYDDVWARNPDTGHCCVYASSYVAPLDWSVFTSESDCETSCRCADVTPSDFSMIETANTVTLATERVTLECGCSGGGCPATLDELLGQLCSAGPQPQLTMLRGCGMVEIRSSGGFTGGSWVFDQATGALVGSVQWSDVPEPPCQAYTTIAGREFACEGATECALCAPDAGSFGADLPACDVPTPAEQTP